jgi:hypothetical protein
LHLRSVALELQQRNEHQRSVYVASNASAKWAAGPALDGQCATLLRLALSEGLGFTCARGAGDLRMQALLNLLCVQRRMV